LFRKRPDLIEGILGKGSRIVQPPQSIRGSPYIRTSKSQASDDRRPLEGVLAAEGIHRDIGATDDGVKAPVKVIVPAQSRQTQAVPRNDTSSVRVPRGLARYHSATAGSLAARAKAAIEANTLRETPSTETIKPTRKRTSTPPPTSANPPALGKGQAHDPLEDTLFLHIGTGSYNDPARPSPINTNNVAPDSSHIIVSESPSAVDIDVYETAYQEEIQRIIKAKESREGGRRPTLYLTRRVEGIKALRDNEYIMDTARLGADSAKQGFQKLVEKARSAQKDTEEGEKECLGGGKKGVEIADRAAGSEAEKKETATAKTAETSTPTKGETSTPAKAETSTPAAQEPKIEKADETLDERSKTSAKTPTETPAVKLDATTPEKETKVGFRENLLAKGRLGLGRIKSAVAEKKDDGAGAGASNGTT
jgi:[calcium/calmodulin-dependent protein kinase] kinase